MNQETCLPVARGNSVYDEVHTILTAVGGRLGIPLEDAELLRLHSNATFALPSAGLLVRIATNPAAYQRIATAIAITRWLGRRGFPCTVPADIAGQPFTERGKVVSFWRYVPLAPEPEPTGADLGRLLHDLHAQPDPPQSPGKLADPFISVVSAIEEQPHAMADEDRDWLKERIASLRGQWNALDFPLPAGLIHGDAHIGNLMRSASGQVILGDWDHVATGPREWDLVQIHYIHRRFGRAADEDINAFTTSYGWDIRDWPGLETLIAVREITGLSAHIRTAPYKPFTREQLAYRLDTLRRGETTARWLSPPG